MKLPKFIIDRIKAKNTSLGDNLALPPEENYAFEYVLIKKRFNEICGAFVQHFHDVNINQLDVIVSLLNKKMTQCQQLESSVRPQLEKLCENTVINLLQVPAETVLFECHLVDDIQPKHDLSVMPESASNRDFDFNDLTDYENVNKVILKRRFLNTLIQGAAHYYALFDEALLQAVKEINPKLNLLYFEIGVLNELLLYTKEEKISDTHKPQGACVEVEVNGNDEKTSIYVQGKLFPFLLQESLRGFYELFASHGLPQDNKKANYILKQSDFLLAEPWDMRIGIPMWKHLINDDLTPQISPYFFMAISCTPVDEFNTKMREMLAKTKVGKDYFQTLKNEALHDYEMDSMIATINLKNDEENLLNDSYISAEELDDIVIEEEVLMENATPQLYHYCSISSLLKILNTNRLYLNGNEQEYNDNRNQYFASFTRNRNSKQGYPYMQSRYSMGGGTEHNLGSRYMICRIDFDGDMLNRYNQFRDAKGNRGAFKVKPFDYLYHYSKEEWENGGDEITNGKEDALKSPEPEEQKHQPFSQAEDRLSSNNEYIPHILKYINRVDILIEPKWLFEELHNMDYDPIFVNEVMQELKIILHLYQTSQGFIHLFINQDEFDHQTHEIDERLLYQLLFKCAAFLEEGVDGEISF